MTTNQRGIDLIKHFEGLRLKVYLCPGVVPTIGYGHTSGVTMGTLPITEAQAEAFLVEDMRAFESGVELAVKVPLTSNQFSALVSFAFNVGPTNFSESTLLKRLNEGAYGLAADQFIRWIYSGGKSMAGLKRRRKAERILFERGDG